MLTVSNSTFSGNSAYYGGISALAAASSNNGGTLTVSNSTFSGNSASFAAAVAIRQRRLRHSDREQQHFSGNSANDYGGGIYNGGTLTVSNSTFSSNSCRL